MEIMKQSRLGHEVSGWARSIIDILQNMHTRDQTKLILDIFIPKIVEYYSPYAYKELVRIGRPARCSS